MSILLNGQLEIDAERGVIYFHSKETGATVLRICNLPKPIPETDAGMRRGIDITHMVGCDWERGVAFSGGYKEGLMTKK